MSTQSGACKWFNANKGFGFLVPDHGGPDIFVHISGVLSGQPLNEGQKVIFDTIMDKKKGKPNAVNVKAA